MMTSPKGHATSKLSAQATSKVPSRKVRRPIFSIGVAASLAGVPVRTIRRWEQAGIVAPARAANGWRLYSWDDLEALRRARLLVRRGVRVGDVRRRIRAGTTPGGLRSRIALRARPLRRRTAQTLPIPLVVGRGERISG